MSSFLHNQTLIFIVIVNVLIVLIIYALFHFWKCGKGSVHDQSLHDPTSINSNNSSPCCSPRASRAMAKDLSFLPEFVHGENNGDEEKKECAVCITEFFEGQIGRILPICGHKFHKECVDKWFTKNLTCPVCRTVIKENKVEDKGEKICLDV